MLEIYLFGRVEIVCDSGPVDGLEPRKVQELLSYVLLFHERPILRERLAEELWPEADPTKARKYLRQALWQCQKALAGATDQCCPLLMVSQEWIELNRASDVRVDALEFAAAYAQVLSAPGSRLEAGLREILTAATKLYRGRLLEGWYHEWCLQLQDVYRTRYLAILDKLIIDAEIGGHWERGLVYAQRALDEDRANEQTHVRMMRLHCQSGNRVAALRQFDICVEALHEEVAVPPDPATVRLYDHIRKNGEVDPYQAQVLQPTPARRRLTVAAGSVRRRRALGDFHSQLSQISQSLQEIQAQLDAQIQKLEQE